MKYQTTDGVLDTNKTKYPWGFDVVLKLNMSRTCFGVWDMTEGERREGGEEKSR